MAHPFVHRQFAESYFIQLSQDGEVEDGGSVTGPEPQSYLHQVLHLGFAVQFRFATVAQNSREIFFQIDIFSTENRERRFPKSFLPPGFCERGAVATTRSRSGTCELLAASSAAGYNLAILSA